MCRERIGSNEKSRGPKWARLCFVWFVTELSHPFCGTVFKSAFCKDLHYHLNLGTESREPQCHIVYDIFQQWPYSFQWLKDIGCNYLKGIGNCLVRSLLQWSLERFRLSGSRTCESNATLVVIVGKDSPIQTLNNTYPITAEISWELMRVKWIDMQM